MNKLDKINEICSNITNYDDDEILSSRYIRLNKNNGGRVIRREKDKARKMLNWASYS